MKVAIVVLVLACVSVGATVTVITVSRPPDAPNGVGSAQVDQAAVRHDVGMTATVADLPGVAQDVAESLPKSVIEPAGTAQIYVPPFIRNHPSWPGGNWITARATDERHGIGGYRVYKWRWGDWAFWHSIPPQWPAHWTHYQFGQVAWVWDVPWDQLIIRRGST